MSATLQDGFRSFKGNEKYAGQTWLADNIQKPQVVRLAALL